MNEVMECLTTIENFVQHPRAHNRVTELKRRSAALMALTRLRTMTVEADAQTQTDTNAVLDRLEELYVGDDGGAR